jgi:hypothetical protein
LAHIDPVYFNFTQKYFADVSNKWGPPRLLRGSGLLPPICDSRRLSPAQTVAHS